MSKRYKYGGGIAEVAEASGVSGVLIKTLGGYALRVKDNTQPDGFSDYDLRHDDLPVTLGLSCFASFYTIGEQQILDHSPDVLGLEETSNDQ